MTAYLFPGQGSQSVGMARDLYEDSPHARELMDAAAAALDVPLLDLMFGSGDAEADAETLRQTDVTQPALYLHSMAALAVLEAHTLLPDMVAGHSLGEYSALAAAKAISFTDGLRIVRLRGQLMARADSGRAGTMAAVLGLDDDAVQALCKAASTTEASVQPANYNAPGQIVVSGDVAAVDRAVALGKEHGARRVLKLPVGGAFHSALMGEVQDAFSSALERLDIQPPRCPVYLNVTAEPTRDPEEIRARLLEQLVAPVRWAQILQAMHADGATRFVEVGAGNVLSGLVRRTLGRDVEAVPAGTCAQLDALVEAGHAA